MNVFAETTSTAIPAWHAGFLAMLPAIRSKIRFAFRGLRHEANQEAIQESLASAAVAYARLHEQGRADIAYATPLANFAIRQYLAGRRVGCQLNQNDITSQHAQRFHGICVKSLDERNSDGTWKEILIEDRGFTPAQTAAIRIDFADWLSRLCRRDRGVAKMLATGETGRDTARMHGLTAGRISQLRTVLRRNWQAFQGEPAEEAGELALAAC